MRRAAQDHRMQENVERIEAWAVQTSRKLVAAWLTREIAALPPRLQREFAKATFVWETSGERRELHRIVELIEADRCIRNHWQTTTPFVVHDPRPRTEAGK